MISFVYKKWTKGAIFSPAGPGASDPARPRRLRRIQDDTTRHDTTRHDTTRHDTTRQNKSKRKQTKLMVRRKEQGIGTP
jgi:hypothetical protein